MGGDQPDRSYEDDPEGAGEDLAERVGIDSQLDLDDARSISGVVTMWSKPLAVTSESPGFLHFQGIAGL